MTQGSEDARGKRAAVNGGADRLGGLPDELLRHLLSFLPSRNAVQTCVLARRWRDQWKSVPAIRITPAEAARYRGPSALNKFVNYLLLLRDKSPIREAEINSFDGDPDFDEAVQYLEPWVRYALSCKAQKLCVSNNDEELPWLLPQGLISSVHLTTLELTLVRSDHDLDFSSCPKLMDLKMDRCGLFGNKIISRSLKRLSIIMCALNPDVRVRISVPNLMSLLLVDCSNMTPLLESMPLLVEASVRLQSHADYCKNSYETGDCGDESCWGCRNSNYGKSTVLLDALSGCTNLELTAAPNVFIFRKDLTRCPVFSKLKTLLLNEWCITPKHGALIRFLQQSPVLEKLILQFSPHHESLVEMGARYDLKQQSLILKNLTVEVKCEEVDEWIGRILEVLQLYGLPLEKIEIKQLPPPDGFRFPETWASGSFSFEQKT